MSHLARIVLVALFTAVVSAVDINGTSPSTTPVGMCLMDSTKSWSKTDGTSDYVAFAGCFLASTLNITGVTDRMLPSVRLNASNPANFTAECGAFCGLRYASATKGEGQFVENPSGACECVLPESFMTPRSHANASAPCPPPSGVTPYLRLFEVAPRCSLNASDCGSRDDKCQAQDGCCVYVATEPYQVPHLYVAMVQWTIVAILCIAILEAVVYSCFRLRYPRGADGGNFEGDAELRTKAQAEELSTRLMDTFPPAGPGTSSAASPTAAAGLASLSMLQMDAPSADACVICLEDLASLPSARLPCEHVLHCHCLKEYIAHKLTNRNTVPCPMCRAAIVSQAA
jgi:hypothetical protein